MGFLGVGRGGNATAALRDTQDLTANDDGAAAAQPQDPLGNAAAENAIQRVVTTFGGVDCGQAGSPKDAHSGLSGPLPCTESFKVAKSMLATAI
jgi:hypothetical protein